MKLIKIALFVLSFVFITEQVQADFKVALQNCATTECYVNVVADAIKAGSDPEEVVLEAIALGGPGIAADVAVAAIRYGADPEVVVLAAIKAGGADAVETVFSAVIMQCNAMQISTDWLSTAVEQALLAITDSKEAAAELAMNAAASTNNKAVANSLTNIAGSIKGYIGRLMTLTFASPYL